MKRWPILFISLLIIAVIAAGCGGSDGAASSGDSGTGGGPVGQAEATSCAANRQAITSAARSYDAMEGKPPTSIQALVPGYLQSVPSCPSGGRYTLQGSSVTCSVHGN